MKKWMSYSLIFLLIIGAYFLVLENEEKPEKTYCKGCGEDVLCEDVFDIKNACLCKDCAYDILRVALSDNVRKCVQCCEFFDWKQSFTGDLCDSCADAYAVSCARCYSTTSSWGGCDFALCEHCCAYIFESVEVQNIIMNILRGE